MALEDTRPWREYAAWGSLLCGIASLLISIAAGVHSDRFPDRLKDPWFSWYLLLVGPVSLFGLIVGIAGKGAPRATGVALSGSMLLGLIGCLASG
jgi:uncharacterized membrane protein YdcZ (DUF606 family)